MDDAIVLDSASQVLLQLVYELTAGRNAWPTFTAVDLGADRDLAIEDAQAALAAVPDGYLRRPWGAHGFGDNDEVRLTLRGVAACRGGDEDVALLAQLVTWAAEREQAAPVDSENGVTLSSADFAAAYGLVLALPSEDEEAASNGRGAVDEAQPEQETASAPAEEGGSSFRQVPPAIVAARSRVARLRVIAELLPHFWTGMGIQPEGRWLWQFTVDRQRIRPYRHIHDSAELLDYADAEDAKRAAMRGAQFGAAPLLTGGALVTSPGAEFHAGAPQPSVLSADRSELAIQLTLLREEIVDAAAELVGYGRFDDAIFAAFRRVEHEIQRRAGIVAIGDPLMKQAFDEMNELIRISDRPHDTDRLIQIFSGAIGLYKGDRSHKDRPLLPCRSRRECMRVLAYASSLLDLLDRDVDRAPAVRGSEHRQGDILTLWVERAGPQTEVWFNESTRLDIISYQPGTLVVSVADLPVGEHRLHLIDGSRQGAATTVWLTREPGRSSWYRIVDVGLGLYSDALGNVPLENLTGIRLAIYEAGVESERVVATRETYHVGHYVDWASQTGTTPSTGPVWVRDHLGGSLVQIWDDSLVFDGQPLAPAHPERLIRISMQPGRLVVRKGEKAPLRVMGHYTDGTATWTQPMDSPEVTSVDKTIAFFKGGVVHGKAPGSVTLRCVVDGCYAEAKVEIAAHPRGTMSEVMTGLPPVSGLAWTAQGLVVSVRGTGLWRVGDDGGYRLVAAVPSKALDHGGTDTLAARDKDGELAVRLVGATDILVLHAADDYASSHWVTFGADGVPMACAWSGEDLLVATSAGEIRRIGADGMLALMATVQGVPTGLACTDDFLLVLSRMPGDLPDSLWQITFDNPAVTTNLLAGRQFSTVEGVLWTGSEILLSDFHAGKILRLQGGELTTFADGLANPSQLVIAKSGDVYVAEFGAGAVRRVFA